MLAQTMINKVRRQLVETVASFWSDAELLDLINEAEKDFHNKIRMMESTAVMSTVVGRANYPLPSNWVSDRGMFYNAQTETGLPDWQRLSPTNLEKMAQENRNFLANDTNSLDTPNSYWIWGREVYLYPVPDEVRDVYMFFKSSPVPLTAATQHLNTDENLIDGIQAYVLWKAWSKEKELDLAATEKETYMTYIQEGRRFVKKQSGDQKYRLDIESNMPFNYGSEFTRGFNPF